MLGVLCALAATAGEPSVAVSARPHFGYQVGREQLTLPLRYPYSSTQIVLDYPTELFLLGAEFGVHGSRFSFVAGIETTLGNPGRRMGEDRTFYPSDRPSSVLYATQSRAQLRALTVDAALRVRLAAAGRDAVGHLVTGARFESNAFNTFGMTGYGTQPDGRISRAELADDVEIVRYKSRYLVPFVGLRFDLRPFDAVSVAVEVRALHAWSSHDQDELLRFKDMHASARAFGWSAAIESAYDFGSGEEQWLLGLRGEIVDLETSGGTMHHSYRADDPATDGYDDAAHPFDSAFAYRYLRARFTVFGEARF